MTIRSRVSIARTRAGSCGAASFGQSSGEHATTACGKGARRAEEGHYLAESVGAAAGPMPEDRASLVFCVAYGGSGCRPKRREDGTRRAIRRTSPAACLLAPGG